MSLSKQMSKYYYKKSHTHSIKRWGRIFGVGITLVGLGIVAYIFFPLLLWQVTLAPVFASQDVSSPIPRVTMVSPLTMKSLLAASVQSINTNFDDANNWFANEQVQQGHYAVSSYIISIPSIGVTNAVVSTADPDLGKHMVQLGGSTLPPGKGTTIVFGHSTLPQLFDPTNYHTILANAYKIKVGDLFLITVGNITYTYKIFNLLVVDPDDTSVLIQHYDDSYFELITCTPPGTVWQRLVVQARLQKI